MLQHWVAMHAIMTCHHDLQPIAFNEIIFTIHYFFVLCKQATDRLSFTDRLKFLWSFFSLPDFDLTCDFQIVHGQRPLPVEHEQYWAGRPEEVQQHGVGQDVHSIADTCAQKDTASIIIIIKVFIKCKTLSVETILSVYMHAHRHTHTHTHVLRDSGGVVNSLDFCPASLKSLGCFYFRCVLSSQWLAVTVN